MQHGKQAIVESHHPYKIHGKSIAKVGDTIACGATITNGIDNMTIVTAPRTTFL